MCSLMCMTGMSLYTSLVCYIVFNSHSPAPYVYVSASLTSMCVFKENVHATGKLRVFSKWQPKLWGMQFNEDLLLLLPWPVRVSVTYGWAFILAQETLRGEGGGGGGGYVGNNPYEVTGSVFVVPPSASHTRFDWWKGWGLKIAFYDVANVNTPVSKPYREAAAAGWLKMEAGDLEEFK